MWINKLKGVLLHIFLKNICRHVIFQFCQKNLMPAISLCLMSSYATAKAVFDIPYILAYRSRHHIGRTIRFVLKNLI